MKKMSKAVLVFDMPRSCIECPCLDENLVSRTCGAMDEYTKLDKFEVFGLKPDWCPLKKMPEKAYNGTTNQISNAFTRGWDACIDEILGTAN